MLTWFYCKLGVVAFSKSSNHLMACQGSSPHISRLGAIDKHTEGRSGLPNN